MITIWGRTTSSNVQTVMWAIAELGLEHERIDAGGPFGGLDTPEFAAMNPNRLVPVLRDGGEYLWESASIVRYLGARYGSERFWPKDPLARAKLDQWSDWTKTTLVPAFLTNVFLPMMRNKPGERDEAALAKGVDGLAKVMRVFDGWPRATISAAASPASPIASPARCSTVISRWRSSAPTCPTSKPITTG